MISVCDRAAACVRLGSADAAACAPHFLDAKHGVWSTEGCPFANISVNERAYKHVFFSLAQTYTLMWPETHLCGAPMVAN